MKDVDGPLPGLLETLSPPTFFFPDAVLATDVFRPFFLDAPPRKANRASYEVEILLVERILSLFCCRVQTKGVDGGFNDEMDRPKIHSRPSHDATTNNVNTTIAVPKLRPMITVNVL